MLGNNSDGIENRNGTASALLHIDESAGLGRLAKQKPKKRRRPDSRQYQTGEGHEFHSAACFASSQMKLKYFYRGVVMAF